MRNCPFVLLLFALSAGCSQKTPNEPVAAASSAVPVAAASTPSAAAMCSSPATYNTLKDIVFNQAIEASGNDAVALNDLRRASAVRLDFPLVQGFDASLGRADCSGRIVIGVPNAATAAFGGIHELKADITYSIQPAADGNGSVVKADGIAPIVSSIVQADALRVQHALAMSGGPQLVKTYNPSFNCGARLSNTERMICQDEGLSQKDRDFSDLIKARLANANGDERRGILENDRAVLAERGKCADIACLNGWYDQQLAQ